MTKKMRMAVLAQADAPKNQPYVVGSSSVTQIFGSPNGRYSQDADCIEAAIPIQQEGA
jgi:hypothetical protein